MANDLAHDQAGEERKHQRGDDQVSTDARLAPERDLGDRPKEQPGDATVEHEVDDDGHDALVDDEKSTMFGGQHDRSPGVGFGVRRRRHRR
jgi:hypothetical protein